VLEKLFEADLEKSCMILQKFGRIRLEFNFKKDELFFKSFFLDISVAEGDQLNEGT